MYDISLGKQKADFWITLIIQFYFAVTGPRSCKSNGHPAITKEFLWRLPIFHFLVEISVSNGYVSIENLGLLKRSKRPKSTMFPDGVTSGQKKNCKTVLDLHQRQKLVYLLTLSKKLYGFICVLTNSKPQTGHVTWSRKKLSLWAIVDSLDLTEELMWKSGVFLFTLATAGNDFIVIRKNKTCLIVISQKNLREFAGKRLDRWLK